MKQPRKNRTSLGKRREQQPSFTRILHRHGLCPAAMSVSDAFDLFLRVAADHVVIALKPRTIVPKTNQLGIYAPTAAALAKMTEVQKKALLQRLESNFRLAEYR
jgi:hypothetical protein